MRLGFPPRGPYQGLVRARSNASEPTSPVTPVPSADPIPTAAPSVASPAAVPTADIAPSAAATTSSTQILVVSAASSTTEAPPTTEVALPAAATSSSIVEPSPSSSTVEAPTPDIAPAAAATTSSVLASPPPTSSASESIAATPAQASVAEAPSPAAAQPSAAAEAPSPAVAQPSAADASPASPDAVSSTPATSANHPNSPSPPQATTSTTAVPTDRAPSHTSAHDAPAQSTTTLAAQRGGGSKSTASISSAPPTKSTSSKLGDTGDPTSILQDRPSTFITISATEAADSLPSSSFGVAGSSGSGTGTGNEGTGGSDGGAITATSADNSTAHSKTVAVGVTLGVIGFVALLAGIVFLIRRLLRKHRLGKAYSPPPSPLLNAVSERLPMGIERSMVEHSVMGTGKSEFWSSSDNSSVIGSRMDNGESGYRNEFSGGYKDETASVYSTDLKVGGLGWNEHLGIPPLSPLPPVASLGARVERVNGTRFEMMGSEVVVGKKPLGKGPLGDNTQNF